MFLSMLILSGMLQQSYINNENKFNKLQFHCHVSDDLWAMLYKKKKKQASSGNDCMDEYNRLSELIKLSASSNMTARYS